LFNGISYTCGPRQPRAIPVRLALFPVSIIRVIITMHHVKVLHPFMGN